jgi:hypothetical protein
MKTFTRKQLVSFGNYLLSEQRKSLYEGQEVEQRLSQVNHADVENWLDLEARKYEPKNPPPSKNKEVA